MATGYTYAIKEGKITSAREFFESVSHAFFPECRDGDTIEKQNKYKQEQVKYYKDELKDAQKELQDFLKLSKEEILQKFLDDINKQLVEKEQALKECNTEIERYYNMLNKIKKLEFGDNTLLNNIKKFAIDQLEKSIEFDDMSVQYATDIKNLKQRLTKIDSEIDEYIVVMIKELEQDIIYCQDKIEKYSQESKQENNLRDEFFKALATIPD